MTAFRIALVALTALTALIADGAITLAADLDADRDARAAVVAAAADRGCTVRDPAHDIKRLKSPHEGVYEVRCADAFIIWFHKVDGAWTLKPLG